jgi:hypothetical protein
VSADASGGLGNVAASAAAITVAGLETAHAGAGGNVDLKAAGPLTVLPYALLETGAGTISLAAGVNADGTGSSTGGKLSIGSGATVVSDNAGSDAISLRGTDIDIASGPDPAVVGAHRIVGGATPKDPLTGLKTPTALAFDAQGNVYVSNTNGTTVSVFRPDGSLKATLTGLSGPGPLSFDAQGNLFVLNEVAGTVSKFAPGSTSPTFSHRVAESTDVPCGGRPPGPPRRLTRKPPMTPRFLLRRRDGSKARPGAPRPPARPRLEALEDRLAPAAQLTYGGPGSVLRLQETVIGSTPAVVISFPSRRPACSGSTSGRRRLTPAPRARRRV